MNKIISRLTFVPSAFLIFLHALSGASGQTVDRRERSANALQPPAKVMDAVGIHPGMVIGEVGAGRGRYTVHLATRVGDAGKIYANDINSSSLAYVRERCRRDGIRNVETILGKVDDALFPKAALDMVFMVWVYHMMDEPVAMLKSIIPSLKPGATVVIVDPIPGEVEKELKEYLAAGGNPDAKLNVPTKARIEQDAALAGLQLVQMMEGFLEKDNIFILKVE